MRPKKSVNAGLKVDKVTGNLKVRLKNNGLHELIHLYTVHIFVYRPVILGSDSQ